MITFDTEELKFNLTAEMTHGIISWTVTADEYLDDHLEILGSFTISDTEITVHYEGYGIRLNADLTITETMFSSKEIEVVINNPEVLEEELADLFEEVE